ncbi:hypothetical protein Gasu2_23550 [Galdieria sulphuraria]|uniref:ApaG domain-containing protein n=1 Tax=Galdieria sulphuraria TaxID=130081 RepID=M2Y7C0_GALSU|nr:uncharacterized protein Gasu_09980 [Galdieria sulphuraria]EME31933.1 hypothetical protein Gasu_09980 [Galdieria sulphuraria]GJD08042.1 hypothetical protein Gasu2_23550 [Galdieria sulphuraria]|eukprot:XP_005708453.1 hypothetical protein Gasu_09980 [Galdieria sulphuraria]
MAISILLRAIYRAAKALDTEIARGDFSVLMDEYALLYNFLGKNFGPLEEKPSVKAYEETTYAISTFQLVKEALRRERMRILQTPDTVASEEQHWHRGLSLLQFLHYRTHSLQQLVFESQSESVSQGIKVESYSEYLGESIIPELGRHSFSYYIKLTNLEHAEPVTILGRSWRVTDILGRKGRLKPVGLSNQKNPVISKGQSFGYEGQTVIDTKKGTIYGSFEVLKSHSLSLFVANMAPLGLRGKHVVSKVTLT